MKKKFLGITVCALAMTAFVACSKAEAPVVEEPVDVVEVSAADVAGYYVNEYTEEFDGEAVTISQSITLFDDNTCMLSLQDNVEGTWSNGKITLADGVEYAFTVADGVLSVDMDGVTVNFNKFVEEEGTPVEQALTGYDSIISGLTEGQYYGFADACETCDLLLVSESVYDFGDGTMVAMDATVYALDENGAPVEMGVVSSAGTAYPVAVVDGCLITGSNHTMMMEYVQDGNMMTKLYASEMYDEDGNASYSVFDLDAQYEGPVDDDSRLMEMFDKYNAATVVSFTAAN